MSFCFVAPTALPAHGLLRAASSPRLTSRAPKRPQARATRRARHGKDLARASASSDAGSDVVVSGPYKGMYGEWYLTESDVSGVTAYRASLAATAATTAVATVLALTVGESVPSFVYDGLLVCGTVALGVSLQTIHIYAKALHGALRAAWALGFVGTAALLAAPVTGHCAAVAAYERPALLLAVGWGFVALTGLFVKEAVCFGRREALALIALTPVLVGGKFLGVVGGDVERGLAACFAALFVVFAARKFAQAPTDDLGDKSVFDHLERGGTV